MRGAVFVVLAWVVFSPPTGADGSCHAGGASEQAVNRLGEVVGKDRVYFQDEPKACPARGACPWRRKAYIVLGDRVEEEAVSGSFSCVTYRRYELVAMPVYEEVGSTTGWVPSASICLHPPLRQSRSEPKPVLDAPGRVECEPFTRTVEDDAAFYNGVYRSRTTTLTVTEATSAEMTASLALDSGACHIQGSGTAYVQRPSVATLDLPHAEGDGNLCFARATFDDAGVHLGFVGCTRPGCEQFREDVLTWQK